jgi:acyl-CoA synthetase (AMP-forming)/AMP-acid ligase II
VSTDSLIEPEWVEAAQRPRRSCRFSIQQTLYARSGSAGKPPLFVDIRIVRPDGTACEPNETGELLVSGPNVMAGYWDRADATVDAFRKGSYDPIVEACLPLAGK